MLNSPEPVGAWHWIFIILFKTTGTAAGEMGEKLKKQTKHSEFWKCCLTWSVFMMTHKALSTWSQWRITQHHASGIKNFHCPLPTPISPLLYNRTDYLTPIYSFPAISRMSPASNIPHQTLQETLDNITGRILLALSVWPCSFCDDVNRDQWASAIMAEVVRF